MKTNIIWLQRFYLQALGLTISTAELEAAKAHVQGEGDFDTTIFMAAGLTSSFLFERHQCWGSCQFDGWRESLSKVAPSPRLNQAYSFLVRGDYQSDPLWRGRSGLDLLHQPGVLFMTLEERLLIGIMQNYFKREGQSHALLFDHSNSITLCPNSRVTGETGRFAAVHIHNLSVPVVTFRLPGEVIRDMGPREIRLVAA